MAAHQPHPGDTVIAIYNERTIDYFLLIETHPHYLIQNEREPDLILRLVRRDRKWQILGLTEEHFIIISKPFALRDNHKCHHLYKEYKKICTPIWNEKVESGKNDDYYVDLISKFTMCRDGRIEHISECGINDIAHIGAVIKMELLLHRTERQRELERAKRFEELESDIDNTLNLWNQPKNEYLTAKLRNIPRAVLIEYLVENQRCVEEWMEALFGAVHESYHLGVEQCLLPRDHLIYLLEKIYESSGSDSDTCLNLDDLLLAKSKAVRKAYKSLGVPPLILS